MRPRESGVCVAPHNRLGDEVRRVDVVERGGAGGGGCLMAQERTARRCLAGALETEGSGSIKE